MSFSAWQSQFGETSHTNAIWKHGLFWQMAFVYSAILQFKRLFDASNVAPIASFGQTPMQRPQPTHLSWSMTAFFSLTVTPVCAQTFVQLEQPIHLSAETVGFPSLCISIFPAREPPPIPIFLIAPPKLAASCPLK